MRKTNVAIYAAAALGLCLMSPNGASAFPAADGAGKAYTQTVTGKNAVIPVRCAWRWGHGGWGGRGWGGRGYGFGRGIGWRGGYGLGRGFGWRGAGWRGGYYGGYGGYGGYGLGLGWGWPLGLGLGVGAAATDWGWGGYPGYYGGGYYPAYYGGAGCGW